jgi:hypothetical protein
MMLSTIKLIATDFCTQSVLWSQPSDSDATFYWWTITTPNILLEKSVETEAEM